MNIKKYFSNIFKESDYDVLSKKIKSKNYKIIEKLNISEMEKISKLSEQNRDNKIKEIIKNLSGKISKGLIGYTFNFSELPMFNYHLNIHKSNYLLAMYGEDDYFGEDDHMAHHYNTSVYYRDLPDLQKRKNEEFKRYKASVFKEISIVELSIYVLFGVWDRLADHFVDYSNSMTKKEVMAMLKDRAERVETTFDRYQLYLQNPTKEARTEFYETKKAQ